MQAARQSLVDHGRRLVAGGYVVGADGNLSVRDRDGVLITPPESENILEGVTRKVLIQLAQEDLDLTVVQRSLDRSELYVAEEVFLRHALRRVREDHVLRHDPTTGDDHQQRAEDDETPSPNRISPPRPACRFAHIRPP